MTSAHATTCSTAVDLRPAEMKWNENEYFSQITVAFLSRHFLTSSVISAASDIEREKSDKFCSEALILAWGSFTCRKSTTWDPRLYFPYEGSHIQDFYALKKSIEPANLRSRGEYDKPLDHRGRQKVSGMMDKSNFDIRKTWKGRKQTKMEGRESGT